MRLESAETRPELLAHHTTLRVGGPARRMIIAETETELVEAVRDLDAAEEPVFILGGGSNVLIGDDGFDGTVIKIATRGIAEDTAACSGAVITVAAGEQWDPLVQLSIERDWSGLEAMSGIPGLAGATPIQNVGAYGAEVSELISRGAHPRPVHGAHQDSLSRGMRLRLSDITIQVRSRSLSWCSR